MTQLADPYTLTSLEQLTQLYGAVGEASTKKEVPYIHPHYRALIEASPFAILATHGPGGLDTSPRGDPPGFVMVEDEKTLLLPERRGNNRIDSLRNIMADPQVALLFLIPGLNETLRVNGTASLSINPALLQRFVMNNQPPKCVVVIKVETVFFQCGRAMQRSHLWDTHPKPNVPTAGTILEALTECSINGEDYDRDLPARQQATLY